MKKKLGKKVFPVSMLVLSIFFITSQIMCAYSQNEAEKLIGEAEESIIDAYVILLDAERSGANVIPMLKILDSAANRINQAKITLDEGYGEPSIDEIEATIILLNDVLNEATRLKNSAIRNRQDAQRLIILYSLAKVVVFLVVVFFSWFYLKSLRRKRILGYKPEIVQYVKQ